MPELNGNLFVCDPTSQLVTRNKLVPNGASYTAERVGEKKDFLVSGDEWSRPVHVRNGHDGALYICDMYRRFIDHARFFPEDFQKSHYMRAGFDQGRIWKLVPKGSKPAATAALPKTAADMVKELESPTAWRRIQTQRMLVEKGDASIAGQLETLLMESESPVARAHAMWTLHALKKLSALQVAGLLMDSDPGVLENAIFLATKHFSEDEEITKNLAALTTHENDRVRFLAVAHLSGAKVQVDGTDFVRRNPKDPWARRALASSFGNQAGGVLSELLADKKFVTESKPGHAETLQEFATLAAANGDVLKIGEAIGHLSDDPGWAHFAVVNGLNTGLRKSKLKQKSLAALIASPPAELGDNTAAKLKGILDKATELALDSKRPAVDRISALPLVTQQGFEKAMPVIEKLIAASEPSEIQSAACQSMSRFNREQVADFFFERWNTLSPTPLREALALIAGNTKTGLKLMKKMKVGEIPTSLMPPMTRWSYGRSSNEEIKKLATELFGKTSGDRAKVINEFRAALKEHKGDAERGKAVFAKAACITCHKIGDTGVDVGPPLADVKMKQPEALLTDILDPNRAVEERWVSAIVETKDGRTLMGLVQADDATAVTLRMPGGVTEAIPRTEIKNFIATGLSLMPIGLEGAITKPEMADLIAFLKAR